MVFTIKKAIILLQQKVPSADPIYYWRIDNNSFVICTKQVNPFDANYYKVFGDGQVIYTNPIIDKLGDVGMKKINGT